MATKVQATDTQQKLFGELVEGTEFVLDIHDRPKRQFNILAKCLGWVGGEEPWNTNWQRCFDEEYIWRGDGATLKRDRAVTYYGYKNAIIENDKETTVDGDYNKTCGQSETIWHSHQGFEPDLTANFVDEFKRLAEFIGWDKDEQKEQRPEYIDADFSRFYGAYGQTLDDWQTLCRHCKVTPVPPTIDECVSALKNVLVNIVNLIDNGRNGEPIHVFKLKRTFIDYTWPGRAYPLNRAISNPLMAVLLRPVSRRWYNREADKEFKEYATGRTSN